MPVFGPLCPLCLEDWLSFIRSPSRVFLPRFRRSDGHPDDSLLSRFVVVELRYALQTHRNATSLRFSFQPYTLSFDIVERIEGPFL